MSAARKEAERAAPWLAVIDTVMVAGPLPEAGDAVAQEGRPLIDQSMRYRCRSKARGCRPKRRIANNVEGGVDQILLGLVGEDVVGLRQA